MESRCAAGPEIGFSLQEWRAYDLAELISRRTGSSRALTQKTSGRLYHHPILKRVAFTETLSSLPGPGFPKAADVALSLIETLRLDGQ